MHVTPTCPRSSSHLFLTWPQNGSQKSTQKHFDGRDLWALMCPRAFLVAALSSKLPARRAQHTHGRDAGAPPVRGRRQVARSGGVGGPGGAVQPGRGDCLGMGARPAGGGGGSCPGRGATHARGAPLEPSRTPAEACIATSAWKPVPSKLLGPRCRHLGIASKGSMLLSAAHTLRTSRLWSCHAENAVPRL